MNGQTIKRYKVNIQVEHVVFGYQDVALCVHNTGKRGDKILDEYLVAVFWLRENTICRIDTFLSDVNMANAFYA